MKGKPEILFINGINARFPFLVEMLMDDGMDVKVANDSLGWLDLPEKMWPDIIIIDIDHDNMEYINTLAPLGKHGSPLVIAIADSRNREDIDRAFEYGAFDFVSHPFNLIDIKNKIHNALYHKRTKKIIKS